MRRLDIPSRRPPEDDPDDDPATVAARLQTRQKPIPAVNDDPTVQLSRMPISFIRGESVMDPETVFDQRPAAARWREDIEDERPPARLPSAMPDGSTTTLARALPEEPLVHETTNLLESWLGPSAAILLPLVGGAFAGLVFILIVFAIWAGSP